MLRLIFALCLTVAIPLASGCDLLDSPVLLFGGPETVGAQVFVEGSLVGAMEAVLNGEEGRLTVRLPPGTHRIDVKQPHSGTFQSIVVVQRWTEYFMEVTLPASFPPGPAARRSGPSGFRP
ncbi:MAG: hypothetical protein ACREI3_07490 [Nitrospirales bacterium]